MLGDNFIYLFNSEPVFRGFYYTRMPTDIASSRFLYPGMQMGTIRTFRERELNPDVTTGAESGWKVPSLCAQNNLLNSLNLKVPFYTAKP